MANPIKYHHGDLRAALVSAALGVVERDGYEAISLRSLAEELGVSRGAPYRHFNERNDLLAAVASHGFEILAGFLRDIPKQGYLPCKALVESCRRFLEFAFTRRQHFRLMYESGLLAEISRYPELQAAQNAAYAGISALYAAAVPALDARELRLRMITMWVGLYGYAKVSQTGILQDYMTLSLSSRDMEDAVLRAAIGESVFQRSQTES
ncbi:MAG: TetR/AcrR family transcriptional regulator [Pseudomonadota bacterium]